MDFTLDKPTPKYVNVGFFDLRQEFARGARAKANGLSKCAVLWSGESIVASTWFSTKLADFVLFA